MPQERIWEDPNRPKLTDFPEPVRREVLRRLARMATEYLQRKRKDEPVQPHVRE